MDNKVKNVLLIVLIIGLVGMTSAYALLAQNLKITSTAEVSGSNWNIHFESLTEDTNSTGTVTTPAELESSTVISGLNATFKLPGEYVAYTFDISNAGDIDAIIESVSEPTITCTPEGTDATLVCENVSYTLTYTTDTTEEQTGTVITAGTEVAKGQILNAGQKVNVTLQIKFDATQVPTSDIAITGLDTTILYQQN